MFGDRFPTAEPELTVTRARAIVAPANTAPAALQMRIITMIGLTMLFNSAGNLFLSAGMKQIGDIGSWMPDRLASLYWHALTNGTIWIGTYDGGLGRLKDGKFTQYRDRDGLFNNGVFQIMEDGRGTPARGTTSPVRSRRRSAPGRERLRVLMKDASH